MTFAVLCCHSELGLWRDSTLVRVSATALFYPISIPLYPKTQCFWNVQLRRRKLNVCVSVSSLFGPVFRITCTVSAVVGARCRSIGNITMVIVPTGVPSTLNKKCPSLHIVAVVLAVCDQIESNPWLSACSCPRRLSTTKDSVLSYY